VVLIFYTFISRKENIMETSQQEVNFSNPFQISSALQFGVIYGLVLFITKALQHYYGEAGVFFASFLSGIIDVDAITLSLSNMAKNGVIDMDVAVKSILIAVMSNSIFKYLYIVIFGNKILVKFMGIFTLVTVLIVVFYLFS
jgi:uncharacterized membrane protein (DUF4010 family)